MITVELTGVLRDEGTIVVFDGWSMDEDFEVLGPAPLPEGGGRSRRRSEAR